MGADDSLLSIRNVAKSFGMATVLSGITFDVGASEFLTILGESGSGKTTLLRILAGFERPDAGEVWMAGERLDPKPAHKRDLNTVFQHYALFPHLSVFENVAYGLRAKKVPATEIEARVATSLSQMRLSEFSARRPAQLSGGQQQRVALARALVNRPRVLLLDEPLSALDANLRRHMQLELKTLQREVGISFVFVTHDQEEAMTLSDRIALLKHGRIEQIDTPQDVYLRPRTAYAARFIGQTNLFEAHVENGSASVGALSWPCSSPPGRTMFSLRPEHIRISSGSASNPATLRPHAAVVRRTFSGFNEIVEADIGRGLQLMVRIPSGAPLPNELFLEIAPENIVPLAPEET